MQEVLYNAIRITKDDESAITAKIKDVEGNYITSGDMQLVIEGADIASIGTFDRETNEWNFIIPSNSELNGRYMYHFQYEGIYLENPQPIYFI